MPNKEEFARGSFKSDNPPSKNKKTNAPDQCACEREGFDIQFHLRLLFYSARVVRSNSIEVLARPNFQNGSQRPLSRSVHHARAHHSSHSYNHPPALLLSQRLIRIEAMIGGYKRF